MDNLLSLNNPTEPVNYHRHLLLCPFAGSSASAFQAWRRMASPSMELLLAIYAGRERRIKEACAESIDALAEGVFSDVSARSIDPRQLLVAGHSMGAQVAFEVCMRLEQRGSPPMGLILSGCHAPHLQGRHPISGLEDRGFLEQLVAIGGCSQALINETTLWPVFLPMLRADFKATEGYWHPQTPPPAARLKTPTLLVHGSRDKEAWPSEVDAWKAWLKDVRCSVSIAGDHFFITRRPRAFLEHIRRCFDLTHPYTIE